MRVCLEFFTTEDHHIVFVVEIPERSCIPSAAWALERFHIVTEVPERSHVSITEGLGDVPCHCH